MRIDIKKNLNKVIREALSINEEEFTYGMDEETFKLVEEAVKKYTSQYPYIFKDNNFEVYVDNEDTYLSDDTLTDIFDNNTPLDAFYDIIGDWNWFENADYTYDDIINNIEIPDEVREENRDKIDEYIRDTISYSIPYDRFDNKVNFDVIMNVNEDQAVDKPFIIYGEEGSENEDIAIGLNANVTRFLELNGRTEKDFINYINNPSDDLFFERVLSELENCTYKYDNCWTFLCTGSIIDVAKAIQNGEEITIPTGTNCGLVEIGQGSGSVVEIETAKNITLKVGTDCTIKYYHGYHYNVDEIYGMTSDMWNGEIKFANTSTSSTATSTNESLKDYKTVATVLQNKQEGGFNITEPNVDNPMLDKDEPSLKKLLKDLANAM